MKSNSICSVVLLLAILVAGVSGNASAQSPNRMETDSINPFELKIINSDYALAYSVITVLTNKVLTISVSSGRVEDRDSILLSTTLQPSAALRQLSEASLSKLKRHYSNSCMEDGMQITLSLKKKGGKTTVQVSNFYQEDIGNILSAVNSIVPRKYRIWYDKEKLTADYNRCKGIR